MEKSRYYKIGVLNENHDLIHEYVTREPMYKIKVLDDVASIIRKVHGENTKILWGSYRGDLPEDVDVITRDHKDDEVLNYNR